MGARGKHGGHDVSVNNSASAASQNRPPSWFEKQMVPSKKTPGKHQQQVMQQHKDKP